MLPVPSGLLRRLEGTTHLSPFVSVIIPENGLQEDQVIRRATFPTLLFLFQVVDRRAYLLQDRGVSQN